MAKNGFKIFDSDTHVGPLINVLDPFMTDAERKKLEGWSEFKAINKKRSEEHTSELQSH